MSPPWYSSDATSIASPNRGDCRADDMWQRSNLKPSDFDSSVDLGRSAGNPVDLDNSANLRARQPLGDASRLVLAAHLGSLHPTCYPLDATRKLKTANRAFLMSWRQTGDPFANEEVNKLAESNSIGRQESLYDIGTPVQAAQPSTVGTTAEIAGTNPNKGLSYLPDARTKSRIVKINRISCKHPPLKAWECVSIHGLSWLGHAHQDLVFRSTTVAVQQPIRRWHFPCYEEQVICFDHLQLDSPMFTRRTSSTPDKTQAILFVKVRQLGCNRSWRFSRREGRYGMAHTSAFEAPGPTYGHQCQASHPPPSVMMSILEQMEDQDASLHTTHPLPLEDAPYNLVFPGNLRRSEETLEDVHRTSAGQRKPGNSATRVSLVASCELEG
ncbi:hypothetical protein BKA70DRAFT_1398836 [Coprinopsis sp. MPI-PUGE-AT-0042]|nr:hypothetical protein BKA70DRAFT_1398836 [Coprinopsis sp. MPI-PUGE-AT-0042]